MKLICGRAGTGKTYYCMNEIKKIIKGNGLNNLNSSSLIYIVPEQFSFEAERELIDIIGDNGIIGTQVLSFKRLAYMIFNELIFKKNNIKDAGKAMLIYHIMVKNDKELKVLKNANKNSGIIDTVINMISEFKRYNINPEDIANVNIKNEYLKMKLYDLSLIYSEYEKNIVDKYIDTDDELTILSDLINSSELIKGAKIWIDEFSGFTPQECEIVRKLNEMADLTVTLCTDDSNEDLFLLNNRTLNKLKNMGIHEVIKLDKIYRYENEELRHLEKNIFKYPYIKYSNEVENIKIIAAENPYKEIETIASYIIKKVRDENLRYENIAILARDLDLYKNLFNMIFSTHNIPYFLDDKRDLYREPIMYLVTSLLDIYINNYSYDSMFSYLKTDLTNIRDKNNIDLIENYVLKWGIKGNVWEKEWTIEDYNLEKINIIRENIITPLIKFKENLKNKKTVKDIITELYNFLVEIGTYNVIKEKIEKLKLEKAGIEIANEYTQVWNIFMELLNEMVEVIGNEIISFDKFKTILKMGISKYKIGLIPSTIDKVIIGDIERTRNSNIKILFVIGVNDGVFPKNFSDEGFINDQERINLMEAGIEIAKDTKLLLFEENFNIYKALTIPSDMLYISYSISTLNGNTLRPSSIINQIKKVFPKILEENTLFAPTESDDISNITSINATFIKLLYKIKEKYNGTEMSDIWKTIYSWYKNNLNEKITKIEKGLSYNNVIKYIQKDSIKKLYGNDMNLSISKLETFSNCPFSFYLKYGLKAKEREIYRLETPDVGLFIHDIIDKFSKYILDNNIEWKDINKEWCDNLVSDIVDGVLKDFKHNLLNSSNRMKHLTLKLKRILKRVMWGITLHFKNGEFNILGSEIEFGKEKELSAIEIELNDKSKIILNGKIDRVDIAKTEEGKYIRIVDYKSSDKALKLSDVYYGIQLQLVTYVDTILENDLKPGGVFYLKLDDPMIKSNRDMSKEEIENELIKALRMKGMVIANARLIKAIDKNMDKESSVINLGLKKDGTYKNMPAITEEEFTSLRKHIKSILKQLGNEINEGNIRNEPLKKKQKTACDYCEYVSVCQFSKELGNKYRIIEDLKDDEVLEKITGRKK